MGNTKTDLQTLERALELLDHELTGLRLDQPLRIRAVGGYAMLKHGLRTEPDRALTMDIDSLTEDYSAQVRAAIARVGEQLGIDPAWLNNDAAADPNMGGAAYTAMKVDAHWQQMPKGTPALANISMEMADVPTLTRMKIAAVDDLALSGRSQDVPDLDELLRHQDITTLTQFCRKYPDPDGEYHSAGLLVAKILAKEPARAAVAQSPSDRLAALTGVATDAPDLADELSDEALLAGFDSDDEEFDDLDDLRDGNDRNHGDRGWDDFDY